MTPSLMKARQINGVDASGNSVPVLVGADGKLLVDTEVTATIDPSTLATAANQTALNAKFGTLTNGMAPVVSGYNYKKSKIQFTAIGSYTANDQVGALVELANFGAYVGGAGRITELRISCSKKTCLPQFEVHFFKAATPTLAGDNGAWSEILADEDIRAGYVIMPVLSVAGGAAGTDFSRSQHDSYGTALSKDIKCAAAATSIWVSLKLINTPATAFDGSPGNTISVHIGWQQG